MLMVNYSPKQACFLSFLLGFPYNERPMLISPNLFINSFIKRPFMKIFLIHYVKFLNAVELNECCWERGEKNYVGEVIIDDWFTK